MDIYSLLHALSITSSMNSKVEILEEHKDLKEVRQVLKWAYNNHTFGLSIAGFHASNLAYQSQDFEFFPALYQILSRFATRDLTGNAAKRVLQDFLNCSANKQGELTLGIINRDLNIGMNAKSINKAIPGLIFVPQYMRMSLPTEAFPEKWNYSSGIYVQTKMDGCFASVVIDYHSHQINIFTREGRPIPLCRLNPTFVRELRDLPYGIYHGELLLVEVSSGNIVKRKESNGIFNKIAKSDVDLPKEYTVLYVAWDMLCSEEDKAPYRSRFNLLKVNLQRSDMKSIRLCDTIVVASYEEVIAIFDQKTAEGEEGIILKKPDNIWQHGTSRSCVKLKQQYHCELRIMGYNMGKIGSKFEYTLGSLVLATDEGDLTVSASGFTDSERSNLYRKIDEIMYTIAMIKFEGVIKDKKGGYSLISPVFEELRSDKSEPDTLKQILDIAGGHVR
jgi:DNA ligase-1